MRAATFRRLLEDERQRLLQQWRDHVALSDELDREEMAVAQTLLDALTADRDLLVENALRVTREGRDVVIAHEKFRIICRYTAGGKPLTGKFEIFPGWKIEGFDEYSSELISERPGTLDEVLVVVARALSEKLETLP